MNNIDNAKNTNENKKGGKSLRSLVKTEESSENKDFEEVMQKVWNPDTQK